ncbi:MAG: NUDIX hydrolase [Thermoanaerobaculia bacterium]
MTPRPPGPPDGAPAPWRVVRRESVADCRVFRVRRDLAVSPVKGTEHAFFVLEGADWVNVVALTEAGKMLFVKQWRHGTGEVTLEIPGGSVDADDASPLAAARRELLEETGWASDDWTELGWVSPNPAIQSNRCYTFLARSCRKVGVPSPDGTEDLRLEAVPETEVPELVRSGRIRHALVLAAFHWLGLRRPELLGASLPSPAAL